MIIDHLNHLSKLRIILASASPRRKELLQMINLPFQVVVSDFEENLDKSYFKTAVDYVLENAIRKAGAVAENLYESSPDLIIGSDTIVVLDDRILEKPRSEAEAYEMLSTLSGKEHTVLSGVAIFTKSDHKKPQCSFYESTRVQFAEIPEDAIWAYIKTREPMDKAGSYGIQGIGGSFVVGIKGCYFNVMGFPLYRFCSELRKLVEDGIT